MNSAANDTQTMSRKTARPITIVDPKDRDHKHLGRHVAGDTLKGHTVTIVPGSCITLSGMAVRNRAEKNPLTGKYTYSNEEVPFFNHFRIGDVAECHAYNLVYTGIVRKITAKTVTVVEYEGTSNEKNYVFSIYRFAQKNWDFDASEASERNANWMD